MGSALKITSTVLIISCFLVIALIYHLGQTPFTDLISSNSEDRRLQSVSNFESSSLYQDLLKKKSKYCDERGLNIKVIGRYQKSATNYPDLLCHASNSLNIDSKPAEWAECFRTLIKDDSRYDVFVLDYYDVADEHLVQLAKRIKKRFPDSLIINLKNWFPMDIGYEGSSGWVTVKDWAHKHGFENMTNKALWTLSDTTLKWELRNTETQAQYFKQATEKSGAWALSKGSEKDVDLRAGEEYRDLLRRRSWMYSDWDVRNEKGDYDVVRGIFDLLEGLDVVRVEKATSWAGNDDPPSCYI